MWRCNEKVSGGAGMTNAISVKERLKKKAIEDGKTMQDNLVTYGLERTIYRLSVSKYAEKFTLKGGIFLYALFDGEYARATMDIDLLAQRIPNNDEGRTIGYWMMETLSETEWMFLMDSVLNSKILTKKEADNLANRITFLVGKRFSDLTNYRQRMGNQPYFVGDDDIDEKVGYIESRVLQQVRLIRQAIKQGKKIKFNLCVYDYGNQKVRLVPYGRHGKVLPETPEKYKEDVHRICSPFDIIFSNGRYYMLGADLETERRTDLKYKLYRIDLMTDVTINRAKAITKEEVGLLELNDLFEYRMENPYMFTGKVERVRIRIDADQFTQVVDWFSDRFKVVGYDADERKYYDIELKVNLNSFTFWVLQYSGCVEVLDTEKKGDKSYRNHIKEMLRKAFEKYEED